MPGFVDNVGAIIGGHGRRAATQLSSKNQQNFVAWGLGAQKPLVATSALSRVGIAILPRPHVHATNASASCSSSASAKTELLLVETRCMSHAIDSSRYVLYGASSGFGLTCYCFCSSVLFLLVPTSLPSSQFRPTKFQSSIM